jgi:hypothetical protein
MIPFLRQAGLLPFVPAARQDTDVLEALVMEAAGEMEARLAVPALAVDDDGPLSKNVPDTGGHVRVWFISGDIPGSRDMSFAVKDRRPGV